MTVIANAQPVELVLLNTVGRVEIRVFDSGGNLINADNVLLTVLELSGATLVTDDLSAATPRMINPEVGRYVFPLGDIAPNTETNSARDLIFKWDIDAPGSFGDASVTQVVKIVTPCTMRLVPYLKLLIDKSAKVVDDDPANPCFLGYTNSQLVMYLEEGLQIINAYEPYPTFSRLDDFPDVFRHVLLESSLIAGVMSQQLFAIDEDVPNFCFVEGTQVALANGSRQPIESIVPGDRVLDRMGRPQTVQAMWCEGTPDNVVEIVTWGGRHMYSTANHEWPVWAWPRTCQCDCGGKVRPGRMFVHGHHARVNNPQKTSGEDTAGVYVRGGGPTAQRLPLGYNPIKRLRADEICVGDFLMVPRKFDPIETDITPDEARVLGYYAAEGHLDRTCRNLHFTFGTHERTTWIADIERIFDEPIRIRLSTKGNALHASTRNDHGRAQQTIRMFELARDHVGSISVSKNLSDDLMRWPVRLKREFIKGAFRGDGHQSWSMSGKGNKFGRSFQVWYSTSSYALASQMQLLLAQIGVPSRTVIDKARKTVIDGCDVYSNHCYKLSIPAPFSFDLADFIWGDGSQVKKYGHGRAGWKMPRPECMVDDDFIYVPVKSVKTVENNQPVYNLTVSGDHSYLVEGIATFNSDQGNSFTIQHGPQLAAFLNQITGRLDKLIPQMKLKLIDSGRVHVQAGTNFRLTQLLNSSPNGALFRNVFFRG